MKGKMTMKLRELITGALLLGVTVMTAQGTFVAQGEADLQVSFINFPTSAEPGDELAYMINVENLGPESAQNVLLTSELPMEATFAQVPDETWRCEASERVVVENGTPVDKSVLECGLELLESGVTAPLSINAIAPSVANVDRVTNLVYVGSDTFDPDGANNEDGFTTQISSVYSDLAVEIESFSNDLLLADLASGLGVRVINLGPNLAENVTALIELPADVVIHEMSGENWACESISNGPLIEEAQQVACTSAQLDVGSAPLISLSIEATGEPRHLEVAATATSDTTDLNPDNDFVREALFVLGEGADLAATINNPTRFALPGESQSYEIAIENLGPAATTDVQVTNTFSTPVELISAMGEGWLCELDTETSVLCQTSSLEVGNADAILLEIASPEGDGQITLTTTASHRLFDPDQLNDIATATTTMAPESADLLALFQPYEAVTRPGEPLSLVIDVENLGPDSSENIEVQLDIPVTAQILEVTAGDWRCEEFAENSTGLNCTRSELAAGERAPIELDVAFSESNRDGLASSLGINSETFDPNGDNNGSFYKHVVVGSYSDLALSVESPTEFVRKGGDFELSLLVENLGPDIAENLRVETALPPGTSLLSQTISLWTCTTSATEQSGQLLKCQLPELGAGASSRLQLALRPDAGFDQDGIEFSAVVESETFDPERSNDFASTQIPYVAAEADLSITQQASFDPTTGTLSLSLEITNSGPDNAAGISLLSLLPFRLSFSGSSGTGWACISRVDEGENVECALTELPSGASSLLELVIEVPSDLGADLVQSFATLSSATYDPDLSNNGILEVILLD